MVAWSLLLAFIALCVAGWALLVAISARLEHVRLERAVVGLIDLTTAKEDATTAAIEARTKELEAARAHLEHLRKKYETTLKLYQESIAIDGPLGSKRVQ
jgi:hypothetical protein